MGQNLLSMSRRDDESKHKKELESALVEIMKLKSRIANLKEVGKDQPASISSALQKGFEIEKEYLGLKKRNANLSFFDKFAKN
ncbi:hypothetical protein MHBO_000747 [Bonamia ostreae]|uniref:Uncharacterized protein n=1 Tax=Bonamia ostreae TaxID=126728 RepID=A0ABV2AGP2_9EUKA